MIKAFIALGSNQGEPKVNIKRALKMMNDSEGINVNKVAPLYLTEPVGYEEQEWFHNTVAEIETTLNPDELLKQLQGIENDLGRVRTIRWGPRTIDLDIALYDDKIINEPHLQVPHPRMEERAFVLAPLRDINPNFVLPSGRTIKSALAELQDKKIICINQKIW